VSGERESKQKEKAEKVGSGSRFLMEKLNVKFPIPFRHPPTRVIPQVFVYHSPNQPISKQYSFFLSSLVNFILGKELSLPSNFKQKVIFQN